MYEKHLIHMGYARGSILGIYWYQPHATKFITVTKA